MVCAADVLTLAAADPSDLVLLGLRCPGWTGTRSPGGCRRWAPLLVAHTGCAAQAERAAAAGRLHLMKPVALAVLAGVLRRFQFALP